jgi:hypothetical protein
LADSRTILPHKYSFGVRQSDIIVTSPSAHHTPQSRGQSRQRRRVGEEEGRWRWTVDGYIVRRSRAAGYHRAHVAARFLQRDTSAFALIPAQSQPSRRPVGRGGRTIHPKQESGRRELTCRPSHPAAVTSHGVYAHPNPHTAPHIRPRRLERKYLALDSGD